MRDQVLFFLTLFIEGSWGFGWLAVVGSIYLFALFSVLFCFLETQLHTITQDDLELIL